MPTYFRESRNVELSLLYYLDTNLAVDWAGTNVVKTFKQVYAKDVDLPIVAVRLSDVNTTRREVGATTLENRYLMTIDIFARSDAQRLDMSDYIKDKLKDSWAHYDHSHVSGDKSSLDRTQNGQDMVADFLTDSKIDFADTVDTKDKYRQTITILIRTSNP